MSDVDGTNPVVGKSVSWRAMSEYYESLGSCEKTSYIAKLEAVGLTLEANP